MDLFFCSVNRRGSSGMGSDEIGTGRQPQFPDKGLTDCKREQIQ